MTTILQKPKTPALSSGSPFTGAGAPPTPTTSRARSLLQRDWQVAEEAVATAEKRAQEEAARRAEMLRQEAEKVRFAYD